jgi:hypothetical protein
MRYKVPNLIAQFDSGCPKVSGLLYQNNLVTELGNGPQEDTEFGGLKGRGKIAPPNSFEQ